MDFLLVIKKRLTTFIGNEAQKKQEEKAQYIEENINSEATQFIDLSILKESNQEESDGVNLDELSKEFEEKEQEQLE